MNKKTLIIISISISILIGILSVLSYKRYKFDKDQEEKMSLLAELTGQTNKYRESELQNLMEKHPEICKLALEMIKETRQKEEEKQQDETFRKLNDYYGN
ncbi:MAG: hypothetical protein ACOC80_08050 [Petrotogales bacterium]